MSGLTVYTPSNELQVHKSIASILETAPSFEMPDKDLRELIIKPAVLKAYMDTGFRYEKEDLTYIVDCLKSEIISNPKLRTIRPEEIKIAISNGVRKEYGDYMGLGLVSFIQFLKGYMNSEERNQAKMLKADNDRQIAFRQKPEPTAEQIAEGRKSTIIRAFKEYAIKGHYDDLGSYVYSSLDKLNLLGFNTADKKQFILDAIESLKSKIHEQLKIELNPSKQRSLKAQFKALSMEEIECNETIISEAKKIGLYAFFDTLILEETKIETLLA